MVTDEERQQYYTGALEAWRFMEEHVPGGVAGAMAAFAVGLGRIEGRPVSISDIANMAQFSRAKVLRLLPALVKTDWVRVEQTPGRTWVYSTHPDPQESRYIDTLILQSNFFAC